VPINTTDHEVAAASIGHVKLRSLLATSGTPMPGIQGLPRSCPPQTRCCSSTKGLLKVPTSALSELPFKSVVYVVLQQFYTGFSTSTGCTGTLSLQNNTVLTAGHCVITGDFLVNPTRVAGVVYFGARNGTYTNAVNITSFAVFEDWVQEYKSVADQALLRLQTAQSGHVYGTSDITHRFSHTTGDHEPFTSVGFPGGGAYGLGGTMSYTPNPHRNQCMGLYAGSQFLTGCYGMQLAIESGMSGGPVFNRQGVIVATNDFSDTEINYSCSNSAIMATLPLTTRRTP